MSKKKISTPGKDHNNAVLKVGKFLKEHNDVVLKAGLSLKGYDVCAVHVSKQKRKENGFEQPLELVAPCWVLSAFVPTQVIFSRKCALDPNWKKPDLAVMRDGFTYVLDVIGTNSPITMTARKFETVIANCEDHKIVGMAFINIPGEPYSDKEKEFKRLRKTFNKLFVKSSHNKYPNWFWDVKSLFSNEFCQDKYGKIRWNKVLVLKQA